jgi:hypothetical protein
VVSAEKGVDCSAEMHRNVGTEEPEQDPAICKPGQKLQQLKKELQQQIARHKAEEWGRRLREQQLDNEEEGELRQPLCLPQLVSHHVKPRSTDRNRRTGPAQVEYGGI